MKKKISFLLILCMVSLIAFTSATYAGFSKQYNPKVEGMHFGVATQENMMISKTGTPGSFRDDIPFSELVGTGIKTLRPVAGSVSTNSIELYQGQYIANSSNYIKFELYFAGSNNMDLYLAGSTSGTVVDSIRIDNPTYAPADVTKIIDSVRVGFLAYETIEKPTPDGIKLEYKAKQTNIYSVNQKTDESYLGGLKYETFNNLGHTSGAQNDVILMSTEANKIYKMDIFVWVESKDVNCIQDVINVNLNINLRFLAVKNESGD